MLFNCSCNLMMINNIVVILYVPILQWYLAIYMQFNFIIFTKVNTVCNQSCEKGFYTCIYKHI